MKKLLCYCDIVLVMLLACVNDFNGLMGFIAYVGLFALVISLTVYMAKNHWFEEVFADED